MYGFSDWSNTVSILAAQVPDAPIQLKNVEKNTNAYQIGITWSAPTFNGGSPLLDYTILFDSGTGTTFTTLV